jgi:hypothetical protein
VSYTVTVVTPTGSYEVVVEQETVDALKDMVDGTSIADAKLAEYIAQTMDLVNQTYKLEAAAAKAWVIEAGRLSHLVDVAESGSSRKMSDLYKNALAMAAKYEGQAASLDVTVTVTDRPRTRAIVRP